MGDFEFSLDGIKFQSSPQFPGLESGTYTPEVLDLVNGCRYLLSDVQIGLVPNLNLSVRQPSACTSSDGSIESTNHEYQIGLSKDGPWYLGAIPDLSVGEYQVFALRVGDFCPVELGRFQVGAKTVDPGALECDEIGRTLW